MRIVALDAADDDARTERALAVALARAPDRLFVFGGAARAAARIAARDLSQRDERFLDVAASFLLDPSTSAKVADVPTRAKLRVPLIEVAVAVGAGAYEPLTSSARAIELLGAQLCIATADGPPAPDEVDNAALWICGGATAYGVEHVRGRALISPADAIVVIDAGAEVRIQRVDAEGNVVESTALSVQAPQSRIQVRG